MEETGKEELEADNVDDKKKVETRANENTEQQEMQRGMEVDSGGFFLKRKRERGEGEPAAYANVLHGDPRHLNNNAEEERLQGVQGSPPAVLCQQRPQRERRGGCRADAVLRTSRYINRHCRPGLNGLSTGLYVVSCLGKGGVLMFHAGKKVKKVERNRGVLVLQ